MPLLFPAPPLAFLASTNSKPICGRLRCRSFCAVGADRPVSPARVARNASPIVATRAPHSRDYRRTPGRCPSGCYISLLAAVPLFRAGSRFCVRGRAKGRSADISSNLPVLAGVHNSGALFGAVFGVVITSLLLQGWTNPPDRTFPGLRQRASLMTLPATGAVRLRDSQKRHASWRERQRPGTSGLTCDRR